jgi:hypothetical protein
MSWTIHLRASHPELPSIERVIGACPALLGRDLTLNALPLAGDDRISKVHASIDVREGRVLVRDEKSTNGTFVRGQPLDPSRWVDVGAADEEIAIRLADWDIRLVARRAPASTTARGPFVAPGSPTVVDSHPFGASQLPTDFGSPSGAGFFVSFAGPVDRLSEPAQAARAALEVLRAAVVAEIGKVPARDRAALVRRLREQYVEVRDDAVLDAHLARLIPEHVQAATPVAGAAAYAALQELSRCYVDGNQAVSTAEDIVAFKERLRMGIDELVGGIVRLVGGVDHYNDRLEVDGAGAAYPREAAEFARAVLEWRDETRDGAQIVRAAVLDVMVQQIGSFQATIRGVRELLTVLDPRTIETEWRNERRRRGRWGGLLARLLGPIGVLRTYKRHHHNLASEEDGWFRVLFGKRFAEEYQAFAREARASGGAHRPPQVAAPAEPQAALAAQLPPAPQAAATEPQRGDAAAPPVRGSTVAMAPALKPSQPPSPAPEPPPTEAQATRGGTVAMAPALKPRAAPRPRGDET